MDNNQDKSREHTVSKESSNSAEQMVLTSPAKCGNERDAIESEDSFSRTDSKMHVEELTVDETYEVSQPETSEKAVDMSTSFCAPFKSEKGVEQVKAFAENPDEGEEGFESLAKATDKDSSETSPRATFLEHDFSVSTEPKVIRPEVKDKYERNLKKFLEVTESQNEIRFRRKTKISEKIIKSDGEISKITDFFGNMSKISTVLSKISLHTSSAPPTFSTVSGNIKENEGLSSIPDKSECDTSKVGPETNKIAPIFENSKSSVSSKIENDSSQVKVLDSNQGKSSGMFKFPTILTCRKTVPHETSKNDSPGMSKIKESATTPTAIRPRDFNVKTRKAFYTFSPNSTGVLRQCQSLPNINRPRQRQEKQRWSLVLDQHPRIVRSLFSDEPEPSTSERREPETANINPVGVSSAASSRHKSKSLSQEESSRIVRSLFSDEPEQSTSERRESTIANINPTGASRAASSRDKSGSLSQEESSHPKVSAQLDRKPKMCRKLTFASPCVKTEKAESAVEAANAPKGKIESPVKRKEVSSDFVECSSSSVKKVRIALDFKRKDEDASNEKMESIHSASKDVPKDYLKLACSSGEKVSPVKRKAEEVEGSLSPETKVKSSKIVSRL